MNAVTWSPSTIESSTPVTVNHWFVSQFDDVNVNPEPTVASPGSPELACNTTSPAGSAVNAAANLVVLPASVTDWTCVAANWNPAVSSSVVVTFKAAVVKPSKPLWLWSSTTSTRIAVTWSPSTIESSAPVIVNTWGVLKFEELNVNGSLTVASV